MTDEYTERRSENEVLTASELRRIVGPPSLPGPQGDFPPLLPPFEPPRPRLTARMILMWFHEPVTEAEQETGHE